MTLFNTIAVRYQLLSFHCYKNDSKVVVLEYMYLKSSCTDKGVSNTVTAYEYLARL